MFGILGIRRDAQQFRTVTVKVHREACQLRSQLASWLARASVPGTVARSRSVTEWLALRLTEIAGGMFAGGEGQAPLSDLDWLGRASKLVNN